MIMFFLYLAKSFQNFWREEGKESHISFSLLLLTPVGTGGEREKVRLIRKMRILIFFLFKFSCERITEYPDLEGMHNDH